MRAREEMADVTISSWPVNLTMAVIRQDIPSFLASSTDNESVIKRTQSVAFEGRIDNVQEAIDYVKSNQNYVW